MSGPQGDGRTAPAPASDGAATSTTGSAGGLAKSMARASNDKGDQAASRGAGPLAAIDPGRSKCGLVISDAQAHVILFAAVLSPDQALAQLREWQEQHSPLVAVLLGNGTGSGPWRQWLAPIAPLIGVPEAGTTLAARQRYWQLEPARGWRRLLPRGLRQPPRDWDDVVAQLLLERHLGRSLTRQLAQGQSPTSRGLA